MTNHFGPLSREDYEEPNCVLCMDKDRPAPIPQRRVREKLDEYMSRRDYAGAERHLNYWLAEAQENGDLRGEFFVRGEMMGHYRKVGNQEQAILNANESLNLIDQLGFEGTLSAGTAYVNAATVYDAFGMPERSIELFEKAKAIYEGNLPENDGRLGGLYNNMGLAYMALRRFGEAYEAFLKALDIMGRVEHGALEQAITYLNLANAVELEHGLEKGEQKIGQYLDKAAALLDDPALPRDGYYAFVCEKCAPTFDYYGYFLVAGDLNERWPWASWAAGPNVWASTMR